MAKHAKAVERLPQEQRELAGRILDRFPPEYRYQAARLISSLNERYGPGVRDSLLCVDSITSHENFRPSYLGTLNLIVNKSGEDAEGALSEFERVISLDNLNIHVLQAARLAVVRGREHSAEALRALRSLASNPAFSKQLNIAFPQKFLRFLDASIVNCRDAPYMGIRAMSSLFINKSFTPSDFNARYARSFGALVRTVRETSTVNWLHGLESFSAVLQNGSIKPQEFDQGSAQSLGNMVNVVVEYTRVEAGSGMRFAEEGVDLSSKGMFIRRTSSIDFTLGSFNRILGDREFRLDMLSEGGLLHRVVNSVTDMPTAMVFLSRILRGARHHPQLLGLVDHIDKKIAHPMAAFYLAESLLSNKSFSSLIDSPGFPERLSRMVSALEGTDNIANYRFSRILGALPHDPDLAPSIGLLYLMLRNRNFTPKLFERAERMVETLGKDADFGIMFLSSYLANSGFKRADERFFSHIEALAEQAGIIQARHPEYSDLCNDLGKFLKMRGFRLEMIEPKKGLIPSLLETLEKTKMETEFIAVSLSSLYKSLKKTGFTKSSERLYREIIRRCGEGIPYALGEVHAALSRKGFGKIHYPVLLEIIRRAGPRASDALGLYNAVLVNPNLRRQALSIGFSRRIARLGTRTTDEKTLHELGLLIWDKKFKQGMLSSLEYIFRYGGPLAPRIIGRILEISMEGEMGFDFLLGPKFVGSVVKVARALSRLGGRRKDEVVDAYLDFVAENAGTVEGILEPEPMIESLEAVAKGAGDMAPEALLSFIPSLTMFSIKEEASEEIGMFIRRYLSGFGKAGRQQAVEGLRLMFASIHDEELYAVMRDEELYEEGRRLAQSLIKRPYINPVVYLNFAQGMDRLGEEMVRDLYDSYGIEHFARYSDDMLEQLHENMGGDVSKPSVFVVFPRYDFNGAFYLEGKKLDELLDDFNVVVYERGDEDGFYEAADDFGRRFKTTSTVVAGAHGTPESMRYGSDDEKGKLDLTDEKELARLKKILGPDPVIILDSCSTGAHPGGIGALMSRVLGAYLVAPTEPGNIIKYHVSDDKKVRATYSVGKAEYHAGVSLRRRKKE